MNERIRELMEQAKIKCWHNGGGLLSDKAFEIVAELIVKECANHIASIHSGNFYAISEDLKEHFGVEE